MATKRTKKKTEAQVEAKSVFTIGLPSEQIYAFWRRLENLALFITDLESVTEKSDRLSHWVYVLPNGAKVEWDATLTSDKKGEEISWRTKPDSDFQHQGTVTFIPAPGERGTEVHVSMNYRLPAGPVGAGLAKLFGQDPEKRIREDLRCLKMILEAGEAAQTKGQPTGEGIQE